jgi:hypothetical protein
MSGIAYGLESSAILSPNRQNASRIVALDDAIRILNDAAALTSTGSLVSWRIVDHARRHLESCISEEISDDSMADITSSATHSSRIVSIRAEPTTGSFSAL